MDVEELAWKLVAPSDMWVLDKLILSSMLGYKCGPVGVPVDVPAEYIVRPIINPMGMGLGCQRVFIEKSTDHLPLGHFWCEIFEGDHFSVDYYYGKQILCVTGKRSLNDFIKWQSWIRTSHKIPLHTLLTSLSHYEYINCEYIGNKLIEVHLRNNPDFSDDMLEFIPVWDDGPYYMPGYELIEVPSNGTSRRGAFIKYLE